MHQGRLLTGINENRHLKDVTMHQARPNYQNVQNLPKGSFYLHIQPHLSRHTPNSGTGHYHEQTIQSLVLMFIHIVIPPSQGILFSHVLFQDFSQVSISSKKPFLIPSNLALSPPVYFPLYVVTLLLCLLYFTFYPVIHKPSLPTLS